jgi:hypothetical protein
MSDKQVSKNVVRRNANTGAPRERIRHAGVAQIGVTVGNHVTEQDSTAYHGVKPMGAGAGFPSQLGNAVAETTPCCVGGGRKIMRSGSQGRS